MAKKTKPAPKPRPISKPKPYGRLAAVLLLLGLAGAPACGDEGTETIVDHAATCTILGGLIAARLIQQECTLDPSFLVDFGIGCATGEPDEEEALACLGAVYALEECPESLPSECLLFAPDVAVTVAAAELECSPPRCPIDPDPTLAGVEPGTGRETAAEVYTGEVAACIGYAQPCGAGAACCAADGLSCLPSKHPAGKRCCRFIDAMGWCRR